ncbi:MAG: choice-of-anchor L domain-containing protein [Bacteroidetes bacterium]|nr:choice-of-anchor L domain-containing protein [Bacteroidota bacterium]
MKKQTPAFLMFLAIFFQVQFAKAQLIVSNALTPQQLAELISGPGVKILNPVVHCGTDGYGKYNATSSNLNITEGLLITSGTIYNAVGPNNVGNKTTYFGAQNTPDTYPLLTNYTGKTIYEYCEFEFDIIPQGDTIKFDFVFASEEYEEWVGSQYNDVFGFFISGPGITGDAGAGVYHNIALLPSSTTAVTINNVNQNTNTAYYQNNNNGTSVQYDGFTKGLKAVSKVTPCATYHLKLIVADASDKLWDSGVFIEKISSNNILLLSQTAGGIPNMVEGCNNGTIEFKRQVITSSPLTVNYWIGGTATNGTDYPLIGSSPAPSNPKTITIPANQSSAYLNINPIADGINEGTEYLTVYLGNPLCSNQIMDSLRFYIQDSLFTTVAPVSDSICAGQSKQITATGGGSAFSWSPSAGLSNAAIASPVASPTATTIYTLTTTASTCVMQKHSKINVSNIQLAFSPVNVLCNGANNGSVGLTVSGGFPPYSYSWSGPSSFTANTQNISGLAPGVYTVSVTGKKACAQSGTVSITQPSSVTASVSSPTVNGGYNIACNGNNSGSASVSASGGTGAYTYSWSTTPVQTTSTASGLTAGIYSVTIKDANNCALTKTITLTQPALLSSTITAKTNVLCYGNTTGAATVTAGGGNAPYTYSWTTTPAQSGASAANLGAGTYTVIIKDANNCQASNTVAITQPTAALSANITSQTNVLCYGNATGSASVTAAGGAGSYTYSWNTSPSQTNAAAVNLSAGSYVVTVKDANNCTVTTPVTITQPASNVSAVINSQTNVSCFGGTNGSATAIASGGVPGYTYSWNTSPVQTTATASGLSAGTYNVIVKDANNCSYSLLANITQPASALTSTITSQSNVLCYGNTSGSATVSGGGGTPAYSYSWNTSPVQTNATATNLASGTYTVTVKDQNNCSTTNTVAITQPANAVSASITTHSNVLCYGAASGVAGVTASGGVGGYTYSWNTIPLQTAATATALAAGNYTVTVKDANNCQVPVSVTISQPSSALTGSVISTTHVLCKGNATGAATAQAGGGSGSYSYAWNSVPVQNTAAASGLIAGNYTVTISDNNGCNVPVKLPVTINEPAAILNANSVSSLYNGYNISCYGGNNGSVNLTVSGGTTGYTYSWSGPSGYSSASEDISGLYAGSYSVVITDAHGCVKNYSVSLSEPLALSLTTTVTPATCPSFNDGMVKLNVSGGTTAYSYAWTGPAAFSASTQNISGLISGNYSVTVTDGNACTKTNVYTVTQPGAIVITYSVSAYPGGNNISCNGYNNGGINSVNVTGGTGAYTYAWTGPGTYTASSANITSLYAGNYQLVVTDAAGCVANKQITLTQPAAITSTVAAGSFIGGYNISCHGAATGQISSGSVGGTPAYTYAWNGPSTFTASTQNITGLVAGVYTLTVKDVNLCAGTQTIALTEPAVLTTSVSSPTVAGGFNITCNGAGTGAINLSVSGGNTAYTYAWSGPSGYTSTTQNPASLVAGNYSITVTDVNGCVSSNTINLTQPAVLLASATSPTVAGGYNITCNGQTNGSVSLNVTGGAMAYQFSWTGSGAYTSSSQNLANIGAGTYSVIVTDANACTTTTAITLTQPSVLLASATSPTVAGGYNITCNGASNGAVNLGINGGTPVYTYAWSGPSGYTSTLQNPASLQAGVYYVTATDANACTATTTIVLTEPAALIANTSSPTYNGGYHITCNGFNNGAINLSAGGGTPAYTYSWSGPSGYSSNVQNPSGVVAGVYTASVTDLNGCMATSSITLTQPAAMTGSLTTGYYNGGYNVSCNGSTDGNVTQVISGGTIPYTIIWNNGTTGTDLNNVGAGTYSVIVTDANNCSITQSITLVQPDPLFAAAVSPSYYGGYNIKCFGTAGGDINLGVTGGTPVYTYAWNGPSSYSATTQNISGLLAGTYTATVTDNNGCVASTTLTLTEPAVLNAAISSPTVAGGYNISCSGQNNGSAAASVTGGTPVYQYAWTGPAGFTSASAVNASLPAGTYSVLVTDTNACTASATVTLTEPATLTATTILSAYAGGYNVSCYGVNTGSINLTVSGGTSAYTFAWFGPLSYTAATQNISGLSAGNYSVLITDANNCTYTLSNTLTEPAAIRDSLLASVFVGGNNISCFNANNGSIQLTTTGGVSPYTQTWSGPAGYTSTSASINALAAGVYTLVVSDANACTKTDTITMKQPALLTDSLTSQVYTGGYNIKCKGDSSGVIWSHALGGTLNYQYAWSGPAAFSANTSDVINVPAGTYTLLVTDTNGCVKTNVITLTETPVALTGTLSVTNIKCHGDSTGAISLAVSGGIPGYVFWWRGPDNYTSANQNISGLGSGIYDVVVTDTNGCQLPINTTITAPNALNYTYTATNPLCYGVTNGSIDATLSGGTTPYTFAWSNGALTEDIFNLASGTYSVHYEDSNHCKDSAVIVLGLPPQALEFTKSVSTIKCFGDTTGSIDITVNGGTLPYTYAWSNGVASEDLNHLGTGNYIVTVTDSKGCLYKDTTTLSQPDPLYITLNSPLQAGGFNVSHYHYADGSIDLTVTGGTSPYNYLWSNGAGTANLSGIPSGTYYITVIDTNGCKVAGSIFLTEPFELEMPSGISPNGDGKNDYFVVHGLEVYPDNKITIYNRWGNIVYSKNGYANDWDGVSNNGSVLPDATYFVVLEIDSAATVLKGYVELRR